MAIKITEFLWPLKFVASLDKLLKNFFGIIFTSNTSKINFFKKGVGVW